jgi:hypothetical protein
MQSKKNHDESNKTGEAWNRIMKDAAREPGVPEILKLLESQQLAQDVAGRSIAAPPDVPPTSHTNTLR